MCVCLWICVTVLCVLPFVQPLFYHIYTQRLTSSKIWVGTVVISYDISSKCCRHISQLVLMGTSAEPPGPLSTLWPFLYSNKRCVCRRTRGYVSGCLKEMFSVCVQMWWLNKRWKKGREHMITWIVCVRVCGIIVLLSLCWGFEVRVNSWRTVCCTGVIHSSKRQNVLHV